MHMPCTRTRAHAPPMPTTLTPRPNLFVFGLQYLYFFAFFCLYWAFLVPAPILAANLPAFLADAVEQYGFDMSAASSAPNGMVVDIALMLAFFIPHSFLARTSTKLLLGTPAPWERAVYVFQSTALLHIQMMLWKSFEGPTLWGEGARMPPAAPP